MVTGTGMVLCKSVSVYIQYTGIMHLNSIHATCSDIFMVEVSASCSKYVCCLKLEVQKYNYRRWHLYFD